MALTLRVFTLLLVIFLCTFYVTMAADEDDGAADSENVHDDNDSPDEDDDSDDKDDDDDDKDDEDDDKSDDDDDSEEDEDKEPPSFEKGPDVHYIVRSEDVVTLPCKVSGDPHPDTVWYFNGSPLDTTKQEIQVSADKKDCTLTFDPFTILDQGYYQCFANNTHGKTMTNVVFLERAVLGQFPAATTEEIPVTEGDPLVLPCPPINCVPHPTYAWSLSQVITDPFPVSVVRDKRITISPNGSLLFSYVKTDDEQRGKIYKCGAFNPILDQTLSGGPVTIKVTPKTLTNTPPKQMAHTDEMIEGIAGKSVSLFCFFSGRPEPVIEWTRKEGDLPAGRHFFQHLKSTLQITKVAKEDAGMYTCTGTNELGSANYTIQLKVVSKPVITAADKPTNKDVPPGNTVTFNCKTDAHPPAEVQWYLNTKPLNESMLGSRISLSDEGTKFTIKEVKDEEGSKDTMVVQCNASNIYGYHLASGYINVKSSTSSLVSMGMFVVMTMVAAVVLAI